MLQFGSCRGPRWFRNKPQWGKLVCWFFSWIEVCFCICAWQQFDWSCNTFYNCNICNYKTRCIIAIFFCHRDACTTCAVFICEAEMSAMFAWTEVSMPLLSSPLMKVSPPCCLRIPQEMTRRVSGWWSCLARVTEHGSKACIIIASFTPKSSFMHRSALSLLWKRKKKTLEKSENSVAIDQILHLYPRNDS